MQFAGAWASLCSSIQHEAGGPTSRAAGRESGLGCPAAAPCGQPALDQTLEVARILEPVAGRRELAAPTGATR